MLDGADVTNVDDRESIVELAAYWPLGFFALLRGGGGGGGGRGGAIVIRFAIWKMFNCANAMVKHFIPWL